MGGVGIIVSDRPGFISRLLQRFLGDGTSAGAIGSLVAAGGRVTEVRAHQVGAIESESAAFSIIVEAETDAQLVAVIVRISTTVPVGLILVTADGVPADRLLCPANAMPYEAALFASMAAGAYRLSVFSNENRGLGIQVLGACSFDQGALLPAKLIPRRALGPMLNWSSYYGPLSPEDVLGRLRVAAFALLSEASPVPWLKDLSLWLEPDDELSRIIMCTGLYEPETLLALERFLTRGGTFIDIGAHCGVYTVFSARCVGPNGTVLAFEPSDREYRRLAANVALNELPQVELIKAAVIDGVRDVALRIARSRNAGHNTIGSKFAYDVPLDHTAHVRGISLDSFHSERKLTRCDVIKIDIEGAELMALRGAKQLIMQLRPVLILEVLEAALATTETKVASLLSWLDAHQYSVHDIDSMTGALLPSAQFPPGVGKNIVALPRAPAI